MVALTEKFTFAATAFALALVISGCAQAKAVRSIEIKATGLNDRSLNDENEERACKKFRPTKKQLIRFFNHAQPPANKGVLIHERYSSCAAEGSIRFSDGSSGQWVLFSSGVSYIKFDDGTTVDLFYRNNHWHDPYACTYGSSEEPEC